jgi:hypothetical protein
MPAVSQSQRGLIFGKRTKYGSKKNTPKKWQWIWEEGWGNEGKLPKKKNEKLVFPKFSEFIIEQNKYKAYDATEEEFKDILTDLVTLDLEDDQVFTPKFNEETDSYIDKIGSSLHPTYLYVRNRDELPIRGPFEIFLLDVKDNEIGFIRGIKGEGFISFNLIYINNDNRSQGIGTEIYKYFLNQGISIKSDDEITDSTYGLYLKLLSKGYKPLIYGDGSVGLKI